MKIILNSVNFKCKASIFLKVSKFLAVFLMICWFLFLSNSSSCSGERTKDLIFYIVRVDVEDCKVNEDLLLNNEHINKQFDVKCKSSQEIYIENVNNKEIPYKIDIMCKGNDDKDVGMEDFDKLEIRVNKYYHYIPFYSHNLEEIAQEKIIYDFVNSKISKFESLSIKRIGETSVKECTIILFKKAL